MSAAKSFHEMMADKMAGGADDASPGGGGDEPDYDEGLKAAASSLIDAVKAEDPDAVAEALKSAYALCGKADGDDEGDGSGGSPGHAALLLIPHGGKGH